MATNSGSSNPSEYLLRVLLSGENTDHRAAVGEQAGPATGNAAPVSSETVAASNSTAQTGADAGEKKVKSEKERTDTPRFLGLYSLPVAAKYEC